MKTMKKIVVAIAMVMAMVFGMGPEKAFAKTFAFGANSEENCKLEKVEDNFNWFVENRNTGSVVRVKTQMIRKTYYGYIWVVRGVDKDGRVVYDQIGLTNEEMTSCAAYFRAVRNGENF